MRPDLLTKEQKASFEMAINNAGGVVAYANEQGVNKGLVSMALNEVFLSPQIAKLIGVVVPVEVMPCPHCGDKAHTYNCQEQVVKPAPKAPRPKRKRTPPSFRCRQDDIEQTRRQIAKYWPGYELVKKER